MLVTKKFLFTEDQLLNDDDYMNKTDADEWIKTKVSTARLFSLISGDRLTPVQLFCLVTG